ncbi:MAG: UDP-N-acetylglucosamine pyrophosphorylase [Kiritimatiellae bacterium]|nr:UDP-N-acetylglucosamine pyrophosphorylase [Kiritimatiellia bacterium]
MKTSGRPVRVLLQTGGVIPDPSSVFIDPAVVPERIAPKTLIHPFCRIYGAQTSIGPGCELGAEGPVTIENCQLGERVKLAGGYFSGSVFLNDSSMGNCARVRPGALLEEFASGAHAVGLKQTLLFPYVTLGSLVNFCDCLTAGGTGRKNHSEVGSAYVHFNFTPHQDKATPSLIGDVPRGVLLDQPPVFLGGQGGLAGPARVAFGAIAPAGMIIRGDVSAAGLVVRGEQPKPAGGRFIAGAYRTIDRIVRNNLIYIGNIYALKAWYRHVRSTFMGRDSFQAACLAGALEKLDLIIRERIGRLDELAGKMPRSIELNEKSGGGAASYLQQQKKLCGQWPEMKDNLLQIAGVEGDPAKRDHLLEEITAGQKSSYLETIAAISSASRQDATEWLQSIVDRTAEIWKK